MQDLGSDEDNSQVEEAKKKVLMKTDTNNSLKKETVIFFAPLSSLLEKIKESLEKVGSIHVLLYLIHLSMDKFLSFYKQVIRYQVIRINSSVCNRV